MSNLLCSIEEESTEHKERIEVSNSTESFSDTWWKFIFFNEDYRNQLLNYSPDGVTNYLKLLSVSYDTDSEQWKSFIENILCNEFTHLGSRCITIGQWKMNYVVFDDKHKWHHILSKIQDFLKVFPVTYPKEHIYMKINHGHFDQLFIVGVEYSSKFICVCYDIDILFK